MITTKPRRGRPPKVKPSTSSVESPVEGPLTGSAWTNLDGVTTVLEIDGGGCIIRTSDGICFVPDVILEEGKLRLLEFPADQETVLALPASPLLPGWPQEIHNADKTWYYRVLDGDGQQSATYVKMLSAPGNIINFDREFFHLPLANQRWGDVKFDRIAFDTLPDHATFPR